KHYRDSLLRKIFSKTFRFAFGRFLFGLDHDIQAGLKVFTRQLWETVKFMPSSGWTFDLEFLHRAKQAGFKIQKHNIIFYKRKNGKSNVNFVKQTAEIGFNALRVRVKRIHPAHIPPSDKYSMLGAGIGHKKRKYITHTTIPHHTTALKTATLSQKIIILLLLTDIALGLYINPLLTLQILIGILSTIYFIDVLFNFYLISKSLDKTNEITSTDEEIGNLKDADLPLYTILCPLYREARVIPQFLDAIEKLSWPNDKLDVILLLEEDDSETIEKAAKMNLPSYVRTIVVPHSIPKTKPKACNFGLAHAKGEYIVVYDAEDIPDPLQLKKAFLGFKKADKNVICLQAKLNYYNSHQNLLTRFFTAEYSLWFGLTLPGLVSLDTTLPLGGTSNHFKIESLKEVEGWDPFNVTEDADLGVRLFNKGYKTGMLDSETLEEANSRVGNWLRQRSRWIKGYMQTYLVHTRGSSRSVNGGSKHSLIFHLIVGGKLAFVLINPFLWLATFSYFALFAYVGPAIEAVYPTVVFYMAVFSLLFGNFLFLYYYMIAVAKKGQWNLVKFVIFVPLYWAMLSLGAFIALYQLILKPHYWEKTVHGFHLDKKRKGSFAEAVIESEEQTAGFVFPWRLRESWAHVITNRSTYLGGFILVLSAVIANFMNFVFNAYLGRVLEFKDFALIGLTGSLLSLSTILFGALVTTTNFRGGFLIGKYNDSAAYSFWKFIRKRAIIISIIITATWLIASPLLNEFFNTGNIYLFLIFGIILFFGLANSIDRGFLSAKLMFRSLSALALFDPLAKLIVVAVLVYFGLKEWAFSAIPIAFLGTFLVAWFLIKKLSKEGAHKAPVAEIKSFPSKFFSASLLMGFSSIAFLTVDILLANYFLPNEEAGKYTLLSLVGKMVYFTGGLTTPFVTPLISRIEGANKNTTKTLYFLLFSTFALSLMGFVAFGIYGHITIPFLYGQKAHSIVPYLIIFTLGIAAYTVSRVLVKYYLVKRVFTFTVVTSLLAILQILLIAKYHSSFGQIAVVMSIVWGSHLILTTALHFGIKYVRAFENNFSDFLALFTTKTEKSDKFGILIFNWRDTKHKWAGGAESYVHELAKRWVKGGNSVTLFCGNDGNSPRNEKVEGVNIIRRGGFYMVYFWAFLYQVLKFRGKFDAIVDSENGIPFFTPFYTRTKKFLLIHHVHQEVFRKSLIPPFSWLALFLEARLMPFAYRNVQVVTVSPSSQKEIIKHRLTKKDPGIVYNGVNHSFYKPAKKSQYPLFSCVGRLKPYKNIDVAIKAFSEVVRSYPLAKLMIVGEGESLPGLQKLTRELDIEKSVSFTGWVTNSRKAKILARSWVVIQPSMIEGWGITVIEANAAGTPVIASNVNGLKDSVINSETGVLVKAGDVDGFVHAMVDFILDEEYRKNMSQNARSWSLNFSWNKSAKEFFDIVSQAYDKKSALKPGGLTYVINRILSIF
ncbi:MAG: glycosyltransferase, partial [Candidatus Levybacteria bacterium]|nr:glycosyltransferase [Candidatus Levybacteria bacterium]